MAKHGITIINKTYVKVPTHGITIIIKTRLSSYIWYNFDY